MTAATVDTLSTAQTARTESAPEAGASSPAHPSPDTSSVPEAGGQASGADSVQAATQEASKKASAADRFSAAAKVERRARESQLRARDVEAKAAAMLKEAEAKLEKAKLLESDPVAFAEQAGIPAEQLARYIIEKGSPEGQARILSKEIEHLKKQFEESKQASKQATEERQRAEQDAAVARTSAHVSRLVDDDKFPYLQSYPERGTVVRAFWDVSRTYYERTGQTPDMQEVLVYLEDQAREEYRHRHEAISKRLGQANTQANGASERAPSGATAPKTLTNGLASHKATESKALDRLPEREQNAILAEQLRQHMRR